MRQSMKARVLLKNDVLCTTAWAIEEFSNDTREKERQKEKEDN